MAILVEERPVETSPGSRPGCTVAGRNGSRSPVHDVAELMRRLSSIPHLVAIDGLDGLDEHGLREVLALLRNGQRTLDLLVAQVGARADVLAELGRSAPAREVLLGRGEVSGRTARIEAARAAVVARVPSLGSAVVSGAIGGAHLDSLTRRTRSLSDEQFDAFPFEHLVTEAARLPADTFDAAVRKAIELLIDDGGLATAEEQRKSSSFRHWFNHRTGMGGFSGKLDPERYEALVTAVDHHTTALAAAAEEPVAKSANLAAAALVDLVTCSGEGRGRLPHVTVIVDQQTLVGGVHEDSIRQTGDGRELSGQAIARLCCDAVLRRVVLDERGVPLAVGRKYRTATDGQWAAIRATYSTCAWHRCQRPLSHCQLHHVREWENGGPTDLANLVPLCSEHHHRVHEGRWSIELRPDRSLVLRKPDGSHHTTTDPPTRIPGGHRRTAP